MKNKLLFSTILGILFVSILGTLLHFTYEWSSNNSIVGLFSAVNESTWEHMKLIFFPMLLFSLIESIRLKDSYSSLFCADTAAILFGTFLIPVIFYTYSGVLGTNIDFINILIFYLCVFLAYCFRYFLVKKETVLPCTFLLILLTVFIILFFVFTKSPPNLGIFEIPQ